MATLSGMLMGVGISSGAAPSSAEETFENSWGRRRVALIYHTLPLNLAQSQVEARRVSW